MFVANSTSQFWSISDLIVAARQWLITDLIPRLYKKFEFRKNFLAMFLSVKNCPKNRKQNRICFITFDSWIKNVFKWDACDQNSYWFWRNFVFQNFPLFSFYPNPKFGFSFSNFSRIARAKKSQISGSFWRLKTWLQKICKIRTFRFF